MNSLKALGFSIKNNDNHSYLLEINFVAIFTIIIAKKKRSTYWIHKEAKQIECLSVHFLVSIYDDMLVSSPFEQSVV